MNYVTNLGILVIIIFLSSFFYFMHNVHKGFVGSILLTATFVASFFMLPWWKALLALAFGLYFGGKLARMQFEKDEQERKKFDE